MVLVTGGEPLLQAEVVELLASLMDDGRTVLLETSGTLGHDKLVPLSEVPPGVHRIVDLKAPGSGIPAELIDWEGIAGLGSGDEIKIVCNDRKDYEWGRDLFRAGDRIPPEAEVTFSPVQDELRPSELAEWILADGLDVCFQIQLHRAVWPEVDRGV
jgi:7-carboxy-7-deazaguanine synthase